VASFQKILNALQLFGIDPVRAWQTIRFLPRLLVTAREYRTLNTSGRFPLRLANAYPILENFVSEAGQVRGDYFHQDLWAARKIYQARPERHVDIGSRIDGFIAHLLTFMPVEVIDVRPLTSDVKGLSFVQEDATHLARFSDGSISSLSSLHAVEHFGLGRFGDPVNPNGSFLAMAALARILAPGGRLYFSVPIGRERLRFNAHRVFSPGTILEAFGNLELLSFAAVDERGAFRSDVAPEQFEDVYQACGLFEFTKRDRAARP